MNVENKFSKNTMLVSVRIRKKKKRTSIFIIKNITNRK